ncbi:uncharacterized protein [Acropora muricata]|uniref:uncharacterized protein n=1 Tax=Acropora muricata TaxID=159855 RepID=UPI0034E4E7F8
MLQVKKIIEDHVSDSEEEEIGDLELPSGENRETHTSWCLCERCAVMPTEKACVCCKEIAFLSKATCDGNVSFLVGLSCITEHESFLTVCPNREVLWTALAAYRQFTWWVHGHLGKTICHVIPSCVVMNIRSAFPSEDGSYTGYIVGDDDESTFDSELEQAWKDFLNG